MQASGEILTKMSDFAQMESLLGPIRRSNRVVARASSSFGLLRPFGRGGALLLHDAPSTLIELRHAR
jgi:hypothetical protein